MITKQQLLDSMRAETEIIKHLATKVTPDKLDYRPTPVQRSMLELMQYMTRMSIVAGIHAVTDGWEHAEELEKEAEAVTLDTFAHQMDVQMEKLESLLEDVEETEATSKPTTMPWGTPTTVSAGLLDMPLKCFVAYRMQLFLYVKATGVYDIGPANCWAGVDMPTQPEAAEAAE